MNDELFKFIIFFKVICGLHRFKKGIYLCYEYTITITYLWFSRS